MVEATAWGRRPRFLLRDRDIVYGGAFGRRLAWLGVEQLLTPVRAPRANAVAERRLGTLRRECLDHLIVRNERHLRAVLAEFTAFYNSARPHRTLGLETPVPAVRSSSGPIRARPVLGGLHHAYGRAAWSRLEFCAPTAICHPAWGAAVAPHRRTPPRTSGTTGGWSRS